MKNMLNNNKVSQVFFAFMAATGAWYWVFWLGMKFDLPVVGILAWVAGAIMFSAVHERLDS